MAPDPEDEVEDDLEEEPQLDTSFKQTIVVDGLPVVPKEKHEKLANVVRKFFSQAGSPPGSPPNTTFSQNNGIIALTKCASRSAGFACAGWLIFIGLFGKVGAAMASIPMPIAASSSRQRNGDAVPPFQKLPFPKRIGCLSVRRNSFIVMLSLAFGLGVVAANGVASFYGKNLDHIYGEAALPAPFPKVETEVSPSSCAVGNNAITVSEADCTLIGGTYTPAMVETKTCANKNGNCCKKYNKGMDSLRTSIILHLKTPYGIAAAPPPAVYLCYSAARARQSRTGIESEGLGGGTRTKGGYG
ncbi:hypothetical protein EMIHUDRAFT_239089 [Emiliania huxleyi CCMP1516]|uniref:Uncharacterized protein n=2 Tax=Emiliania huxleyi TaxID=2903 RepID=A0A0D3JJU1_EMIH1|nr:hypothetical protein EMIHUDRAFT_239089 [Emiliania huxleyi CCMP1516]EOD23776.1 hypothetical protein EMIHUDRAFT_239089 [Emiliania huxleyi CCMP1516]|eukprot:XP_005776205.1 hypothetical protein EMIHUDRAFT_239089 [Emiliania huxleyi CCMP1516]